EADAGGPPAAWHSGGRWTRCCSLVSRGSRPVMGRRIAVGAEGMEAVNTDDVARDAPEAPPAKRVPLWGKVGIGVAIATLVVVVAGFMIHVPYSVISPGEAVPLTGLVKVDGAKTFDKPRGDIRLLFVRERNHVSLWRYLQAKLDSDSDIFK